MRNCPQCGQSEIPLSTGRFLLIIFDQDFVKESGCNKMTCPKCRSLSCYVCRALIKGYDHFDQVSLPFDLRATTWFLSSINIDSSGRGSKSEWYYAHYSSSTFY
jgi:hypothetical protein